MLAKASTIIPSSKDRTTEEPLAHVKAGSNTSTVGMGTQYLGVYQGHPVPKGSRYGDLTLHVEETREGLRCYTLKRTATDSIIILVLGSRWGVTPS
jgi:hypothetical protein